jgi:hypothetical protein
MGGAPSISQSVQLQRNEKEVVKLMMPVYYTEGDVSVEERNLAQISWDLVLNDKSPEFLSRKGQSDFSYDCCVIFFYDSFYLRLFDVHPLCRQLFKAGMKSQGKFLVKMISLSLSELDDKNKFDKNLIKLAQVHFERGVKAVECKTNFFLIAIFCFSSFILFLFFSSSITSLQTELSVKYYFGA